MTARNLALEARLAEIMPLFTEARDALVAITEVGAKLHGVSLSLADRMDAVGTKDWRSALEAETGEPVDCQFQGTDGRWHSFVNDQHKDNTIASGKWPIRNLYTAPPPTVPPGWKLVPVEPTQQMIRAYDPSGSMAGASWGKRQWLAMIAAAPKAPK